MGNKRNPSDPASQGLDLKTATLRIHFRVSTSPNYISLKSEDDDEDARSADARSDAGSQHEDQATGLELPGWEAVLWRGRLYISKLLFSFFQSCSYVEQIISTLKVKQKNFSYGVGMRDVLLD